jgi:hypothetical protein
LIGTCSFSQSDSSYAAEKWRRESERRVHDMKAATNETQRGAALEGAELVRALSGKTLVNRFEVRPDGSHGSFVVQRYFAEDGHFSLTDNPHIYSQYGSENFRWRVQQDQLCILGEPVQPDTWKCYRMARTSDGALQWYIAEPGSAYDGLLTSVTTEIHGGQPKL